ncbi:MAG: DUF2478 domain-containing protein [Bacteroidales bacterium]|nr:DUF2478 domain-containing protein [Bacteroidales bacterium]
MNQNNNNLWLKAAVLGSLWAASEIVLGSFLHNLKIPFRSNILTAIGIVLLISASQQWREKGLMWRSGLVCAIMKSISPSAVIFGPMVAIFMEGLLMEAAIIVFRRTTIGFLIAGALAMTWNFIHFLINKFIFYGFQFFDLYQNSVQFIEHQYHISILNLSQLIMVLLSIYFISGLVVAWIGITIGKKSVKQRVPLKSISVDEVNRIKKTPTTLVFNYSLAWLLIDILGVAAIFIIIYLLDFKISVIAGILIFSVFLFRYPRNVKKIMNAFFMLSLLILILFSIGVVYANHPYRQSLFIGLQNGIEMSLRAIILVVGFAAIGTELKNPVISQWARRSMFHKAAQAIEIAFLTLPTILSSIPPLKIFIKKPALAIYEMISYLDYWFEEAELKYVAKKNVLIITGKEKVGKSTFLGKLVYELKARGLVIGGFVSPAVFEQNQHKGYNLLHLISQQEIPLSRTEPMAGAPKVGNYYFNPQSLEEGNRWLQIENIEQTDLVVIDEIGPWELRRQGWANNLTAIAKNYPNPIILVVRASIVDKVISHWGFQEVSVIDIETDQNPLQNALQVLDKWLR